MYEIGEQVRVDEAQAADVHEKRRCAHVKTSGHRCGRWASRDEELCHAHLSYAQACARSRVEVPLLEDEASIVYVLSQTTHALATGGMPPANGHAVISACKLATRLLELRLKRAQWEAKHGTPTSGTTREVGHPDPILPTAGDMGHRDGEALMAVSDEGGDEPFAAPGQRACDRVRARIEAAAAERVAQEGPRVQLPRFRKEDLSKQWERGLERPLIRNEHNTWLSQEEKDALRAWREKNWRIERAREQRMLDEYFGRVKKEAAHPA